MIAKHVAMRSLKKSDFGALIRYITQAQHKQERVGIVSVTNCHSFGSARRGDLGNSQRPGPEQAGYRAGGSAIRDDGVRLAVSRGVSEVGLEAALRVAIERYGNRLTVTGSDEFKERIATVAAFKRLPVSFVEPSVESRRQSLAGSRSVQSSNVGLSGRVDEPKAKGLVRLLTNLGKPRGRGR